MSRAADETVADSDWPAAWPEGLSYLRVNEGRGTHAAPAVFMPAPVRAAPPSVRFVYACLRLGAARSAADLRRVSGLPERTVRHAVGWLVKNGYAVRGADLRDARRCRIAVRTGPEMVPTPVAIAA